MKNILLDAAITAVTATTAYSAPEKYILDASHSQIVFSYNHLGFSTTWGMFSGLNATTKLLRSELSVGKFAPFICDEVDVMISIEAMKAE